MNTYTKMLPHIDGSDYEIHFWNALRGKRGHKEFLDKGVDAASGAPILTTTAQKKFMTALSQEGVFRSIATAIQAYDNQYRIKTASTNDVAVWVPEGGSVPITDGMEDFGDLNLESHKLAVFLRLEDAFVKDATFNIGDYLISRLAKNFGRAEDNAFINGTGEDMPIGILSTEGGADVGVTTDSITYADVVKLFFSVKPEYRKNGAWLMNDETAMSLRTLKDDGGNYIWNHANDTILGKKVCISEFMPSAGAGAKPIAFGDFSYYWIVDRRPVSIRTLVEQFVLSGHIGYLAYEFLDGKLTRSEAIKVMQMTGSAA